MPTVAAIIQARRKRLQVLVVRGVVETQEWLVSQKAMKEGRQKSETRLCVSTFPRRW